MNTCTELAKTELNEIHGGEITAYDVGYLMGKTAGTCFTLGFGVLAGIVLAPYFS